MRNIIREAFEADHIFTTACVFNGDKYVPSDNSKYAENVANAKNLGYMEFKRGWEMASANHVAKTDHVNE